MKKLWKMRKNREAVSPVIATILMVAITVVLAAVLYVMVMGFGGGQGGQTPAITMTYQKVATGEYNFTVAGVNKNDVKWTDLSIVVSPAGAGAVTSATPNVGAGDIVAVTGLTSGVTCTLTLKYTPTGGAAYQVNFTPTA